MPAVMCWGVSVGVGVLGWECWGGSVGSISWSVIVTKCTEVHVNEAAAHYRLVIMYYVVMLKTSGHHFPLGPPSRYKMCGSKVELH